MILKKFCEIRDEIMLNKQYKVINLNCEACNEKDHTCLECPKLHFVSSPEHVIAKFNYSVPQKRKKKKRKEEKTKNAYKFVNTLKLINEKYFIIPTKSTFSNKKLSEEEEVLNTSFSSSLDFEEKVYLMI